MWVNLKSYNFYHIILIRYFISRVLSESYIIRWYQFET